MTLLDPPIRVALIDDHEIARAGLRALLTGPRVEIIGEGATGFDALAICETLRPDVVLMDFRMPGMDGFAATQRIARDYPETRVVIISMHEDPDYALRARAAGAAAYLPKGTSRREVLSVLELAARHDVSHGEMLLTEELGDALLIRVDSALRRDEFEMHYQPQVTFATGQVERAEALVRWRQPDQRLVFPEAFMASVEASELALPFTRWVIDTALRHCHMWHETGLLIPVAINLAARNLLEADLIQYIVATAAQYGVPLASLELEITETGIMTDPRVAGSTLAALRGVGCRISVDDFGTGHSSLAYLRQLPMDVLKIDRSLVEDFATNERARAVVSATIGLGHDLGLHVVAEGIEDHATWNRLREMGCDAAQGFYVSPALPLAEFVTWARRR